MIGLLLAEAFSAEAIYLQFEMGLQFRAEIRIAFGGETSFIPPQV